MRIIIVLAVPGIGLGNVLHIAPQRGIHVDLAVKRFEQVLGNVARIEHCGLLNDIRGVISSDKVGELLIESVA